MQLYFHLIAVLGMPFPFLCSPHNLLLPVEHQLLDVMNVIRVLVARWKIILHGLVVISHGLVAHWLSEIVENTTALDHLWGGWTMVGFLQRGRPFFSHPSTGIFSELNKL
jgi:hypothetical protein